MGTTLNLKDPRRLCGLFLLGLSGYLTYNVFYQFGGHGIWATVLTVAAQGAAYFSEADILRRKGNFVAYLVAGLDALINIASIQAQISTDLMPNVEVCVMLLNSLGISYSWQHLIYSVGGGTLLAFIPDWMLNGGK
jgi:hypothetical protein